MKRRHWLLRLRILILVTIVVVAVGFCWMRYHDPIQYQNYAKIKGGMHKAEVEALLGCSPGDYTTELKGDLGFGGYSFPGPMTPIAYSEVWEGDHGTIRVAFDTDDKVVWKRPLDRRERAFPIPWLQDTVNEWFMNWALGLPILY